MTMETRVTSMTNTDIFPLSLRLAGKSVVAVGGGAASVRRILSLIRSGAVVTVIAPAIDETLRERARGGELAWLPRQYRTGDLDGAWLAHTATGNTAVDSRVARDAETFRIWCINASDAVTSPAWTPAVAASDDVTVAVNAGGDPRRAAALRDGVQAALDTGSLPLRRHRRRGPGRVALVGGGPGDPGLITARGRRLLAEADVIVTDRLGPRSLLDQVAPDVEVIDVGKRPGSHPVPQDEINRVLVVRAEAGRRVVRLKGGDPYVLGRGGEELQYCRDRGIAVEVVPGVTSAVSVPAAAGIPVTHRGVARGFSVVTGHDELTAMPTGTDHTLVLLMGVASLRRSARTLQDAGRLAETPVGIIEDGFGPGQRVTIGTLADIADKAEAVGVSSPAVIVVGDVVRLSPFAAQAETDSATDSETITDSGNITDSENTADLDTKALI